MADEKSHTRISREEPRLSPAPSRKRSRMGRNMKTDKTELCAVHVPSGFSGRRRGDRMGNAHRGLRSHAVRYPPVHPSLEKDRERHIMHSFRIKQ